MKKSKLMKTVILLFAVLAFSNCEEDGPIEFIVGDSFDTTVALNGLEGLSSYSATTEININDLLGENTTTFLEADIESMSIQLVDYSSGTIDGEISASTGGSILFNNQSVNLTSTSATPITISADQSDILSSISAGKVTFILSGTTTSPIGDNEFSILVSVKIKAKI